MKSDVLISCVFYVFLTSNLSGTSAYVVENDYNVYRLPDTTEPVSYELWIKPLVDVENKNYTFSGRVDIIVKAKWYTTEIILNSRDLIVTSVSGFEDMKTKRSTAVNGYVYDVPNERLVIEIEKTLVPRRLYKFTVEFKGTLRNDFTGFHIYFYDYNDKSRWVVLTHFKPIYARRAFPCYDEPRFKTSYKIAVARKNRHFALSNMPLNRSETNLLSGWSWDHFEPTKPIPTYLVAFMVSDFDKNMKNNDNITMYTRKEFIENTTYMMAKSPNLLENVEKFTQISYMLPKLDMVGIPLLDAYSIGNWGLNSYKEYYLTVSNTSQTEDEMLGTMTILREILHQWFGNMVTNPRWDYVWLNEGICNYLNYIILDKIEPNWNLNDKFIEDVHQHALVWDGFDDTHPLTFSVLKPNEIINVFDPITVDKSAALFRMLNNMVGETYFKKSLNKYLNDFAYAEAGPKELWETFDYVLYEVEYEISDEISVNNSMYLWTEQAGYPLINVISSNDFITVTQERFSLSNPRVQDDTKWFVGLSYTTENNRNFDDVTSKVWLKPSDEKTVIPIPADSGWKIFNLQSTGFYRVNYDEKNWKLLLIQLITKPDRIHVLNRAQIIDDAHHLSRAGLVPYDYYISLLEYLLIEDHVTPWNSATYGLTSIMNSIRRYPEEQLHFKEFTKHIADILYTKLSGGQFENESTKIGWSKLLTWACKTGSSGCEKSALGYFEAWMNGESIPPELEEATFCTGMKYGNFTVWSKIFEYYKKTTGSLSDEQIVASLACIESAETLLKYLNLMRWNDGVSSQKQKSVFVNLVSTSHGVKALASYILNELDSILALEDGHLFASFAYSTLALKVATDDEIHIMDKIRRSVKSNDLRAIFDDKHRMIESNLKWMDKDHKKIIQAIGKIIKLK